MTAGIWGSGPYGEIRKLRSSIKADQEYLDNAPIGPKQKEELRESLELQKRKLAQALKKRKNKKPS